MSQSVNKTHKNFLKDPRLYFGIIALAALICVPLYWQDRSQELASKPPVLPWGGLIGEELAKHAALHPGPEPIIGFSPYFDPAKRGLASQGEAQKVEQSHVPAK